MRNCSQNNEASHDRWRTTSSDDKMPAVVIEESNLTSSPRHDLELPDGPQTADLKDSTFKNSKEFICGWGAALINTSLTFPINKAQFRQQLHGIGLPRAVRQLHKEGLKTLYRGLLPPLLQKTTGLALMFGMYDQFLQVLGRHTELSLLPKQIIAGHLSGAVEAILTPFERVQTLMQDRNYQGKFRNTLHAFTELQQYGPREYYRAMGPIIARNGMSNAMFFALREPVRNALPNFGTSFGHLAMDFVSGAVLGASLSTIFFPINVIKTRMQSTVAEPRLSAWTTFKIVYRERNRSWRKMFFGVHVNYTRALLSWGIINASYEFLRKSLSVER